MSSGRCVSVAVAGLLLLLVAPASADGFQGYAGLTRAPSSGVTASARVGYAVSAVEQHHATTASGPTSDPGVTGEGASSSGPPLYISNRCAGISLGGGFDLFADTSCSAFAPPPAPDPRPDSTKKGRKRPPPSPEQLALIAADRARALAVQPDLRAAPAGIGLTGLDSYFWLEEEPQPVAATASAGGLTVTAEARPAQYIWDFGDGSDKTTSHPGRPWTPAAPGDIAHLYETRGHYEVGVEVLWEARWRIGAGAWQPLGFFSTSDSVDYPVRQLIAVLVKPL